MLQKIARAIVEGRFFRSVGKKLAKGFRLFCKKLNRLLSIPAIYIMSRTIPVEPKTILFVTFRGEYDCNAKWIAQELLSRNEGWKIYWMVNKAHDPSIYPKEFHLVVRGSYDLIHAFSQACVIVDNALNVSYSYYPKKKSQTLIQTWHGSLGIKRISQDRVANKLWVTRAFRESAVTDLLISNSDFEDMVYRDAYWKDTPIAKLGHARNDILCEKDTPRLAALREKIYQRYNLEPDTRICLYAPTFRDDGDMRPYLLDYEGLRSALQTRFGGNWVIITRFHFRMLKKVAKLALPEGVINGSAYPDIQELLTCVDVGITDYSSWICDYLLTRRPGFLFATDVADYGSANRGFYYPLDTLPFPLSSDNEQLIDQVLRFDSGKFAAHCERFLQEKGCIDDGQASRRIVDHILTIEPK